MKVTNIDKEIENIISKATTYSFPTFSFVIHVNNPNETIEDIPISLLTNYTIQHNYNTNITDKIFLDCKLAHSTFLNIILPNKDDLTIDVVMVRNSKSVVRRYKLVVRTNVYDRRDSKVDTSNTDELDTRVPLDVSFELEDLLVSQLRTKVVSGIFHDLTLDRLIKGLYGSVLDGILINGKPIVYRLNIYELDNQEEYSNIIIPPNTKLIQLISGLQNNDYGLYNNDIGIYISNMEVIQGTMIYNIDIFPLYDVNRYEKEEILPKLLLVSTTIPGVELNTYDATWDIDTFKILTGALDFVDSDSERFKIGTGLKVNKSDLVSNTDNITVLEESIEYDNITTNETIDIDYLGDYQKYTYINQDNNIFKYKSTVSENLCNTVTTTLINLNSEFVYPGIPVRYIYTNDDLVKRVTGIVQGMEEQYNFRDTQKQLSLIMKLKDE